MPSVSVVVRCYNEEKHLGRLLKGLLEQTHDDLEIIVVDSGSTDSSQSIALHYGTRLIHIPKEEFSFGRSLNYGCEAAKGEILVAVSAHCYPVYKDWVESLIKPFSDPKVAMCYGKQRGNEQSYFSEHRIFRQWYGEQSNFSQSTPFANNANSAFRRSLWQQYPFNETLTGLEDLDWAHRIMTNGHRLAYVADAPVIHVHEERWDQVFSRYQREAMAMRRLFPHERFNGLDFIRLLTTSVMHDLSEAWRGGVVASELYNILMFRWNQYFGTYQGYRQRNEIDEQLRQTFYYPSGLSPRPINLDEIEEQKSIDYSSPEKSVIEQQKKGIEIIDISVPVNDDLPVWPGDPKPILRKIQSIENNDAADVSVIEMCVHTGTHIDAPSHFIKDGADIESIPLEVLIGDAWVQRVEGNNLDDTVLNSCGIPAACKRLLLHTSNSELWGEESDFNPDFSALTPAGAQWIVDRGIRLVGIDYLSIEKFQEPDNRTHQILLQEGVVIIEGLNLNKAETGAYELFCLPVRLDDAEGSPARAILRRQTYHAG